MQIDNINTQQFTSGVYYIKTPDKCGDICFPNPNQILIAWSEDLLI